MTSTDLERTIPSAAFTAEQRARFVELLTESPDGSHVELARQAGVTGSRGQIRQLVKADEEIQAAIAELHAAQKRSAGLTQARLLEKLMCIVNDDGNSSQFRAIVFGFGLLGVHVTEKTEVEHTGHLEVTNPDVAAAIDRFTALADAAVRAAARTGAGEAAGELGAGGEG